MNKENFSQRILDAVSLLFFLYIFNLIIFGRTFNGIYIFGIRSGEYLIGFAILLTIFVFVFRNFFDVDKKITFNLFLLLLFFLVSFYASKSSFINTYTYKASSYIWTISYLYLGTFIFRSQFTERFIKYLYFTIPLVYIFSLMFFPNPLYNFFATYSDKFDYLKASDILLVYVLLNFLSKRYKKNTDFSFYFFITTSLLLAPLFSYMSRGAFLSFLVYVIIELFLIRNYFLNNKLKAIITIFLGSLLFSFSTIIIMTDVDFEFLNFGTKLQIEKENQVYEVERSDFVRENINSAFRERNFFSGAIGIVYIDGRFYSSEPNADWRLQIWQDVVFDLSEKNRVFTGYGYSDIIPIMKLPKNNGNDSTNENLHNYFVQVYAKGGLIHLLLVISNLFLIIIWWKKTKNNWLILQFLIPLVLVSMFDPSLESVRFPLIFYSFLGYFFINDSAYSYKTN